MPRTEQGRAGNQDVDHPLEQAVEAAQRHVVQADDRHAIEVFEARAESDELKEIRDDVNVDALAIRLLDEREHLDVLFERQGDVDVIDALLANDFAAIGQRPQERQAAIADVIAGAVVEESDDLEAELAMLEQLVGDQPAEVAGARDQNLLEADAGAPATLERLPHELARRVGQDHVDDEEQQPDRPRNLVDTLCLRLGRKERRMVDLIVESADQAEDNGEDAADKDGEEIVDARAPAAEPVKALHLEGERHENPEQRQEIEVLSERWLPFCDRDEVGDPGLEPKEIGDDERRHTEQRVGDDVEGDEQPVVPPHHRAGPPESRLRHRR